MDELRSYYQTLDVEAGASLDEIKQAYRDMVTVWHPDRFEGRPRLQIKAQEKLKEINNAYQMIIKYEGGSREEHRSAEAETWCKEQCRGNKKGTDQYNRDVDHSIVIAVWIIIISMILIGMYESI